MNSSKMYHRLRALLLGASDNDYQKTVARAVRLRGVGVHQGEACEIEIAPAAAGCGIEFRRADMPARSVKAALGAVGDTSLSTNLFLRSRPFVRTVEHVMSALAGCGIDNAILTVSGGEVPIMDGSARPFVEAIARAGVTLQAKSRRFIKVNQPIEVQRDDAWARLSPAWGGGMAVSVAVDYPGTAVGKQQRSFVLSAANYASELAAARTFCFESDIAHMRERGLARGGTLENALVFSEAGVLNPQGLRFEDECVRHKILDVIGDLYLLGHPIIGNVECYRCGHELNVALGNALLNNPASWSWSEREEGMDGMRGIADVAPVPLGGAETGVRVPTLAG